MMVRLYLFVFLLLTEVTSWGQAVFRIDSLPANGVVLDKGWRWHLGDNPDWASTKFDDSRWDTLNPLQPIGTLNKLPQQGIGWLRIHLHLSPQLRNKTISSWTFQAGASEGFLNGKLVFKNGKISPQKQIEIGGGTNEFNEIGLVDDSQQVLSIRYAFSREQLLPGRFPFPFFGLKLIPSDVAQQQPRWWTVLSFEELILFGSFLVLGLLQLLLYATSNKQQSALSLGLFLITLGIATSVNIFRNLNGYIAKLLSITNTILLSEYSYIVFATFLGFSTFYYLVGMYQYFKQPRKAPFVVAAIIALSSIPLSFGLGPFYSYFANFIPAVILPYSEILRIGILGIKQKYSGAKLFTVAHSIMLLMFIGWTIIISLPNVNGSIRDASNYLYLIAYLGQALAISFLLSQERADMNVLLQKQLTDLEKLSQRTIAQEQEKQQILATHNERLEQQVEARTAELKASQAQLIQKEKLASLGELTAGIAHEIQNPLNFVNNFSEVSSELLVEQKEALAKGDLEEANFIANDLTQNLQKIHHHGGRASSIVRGMLEHSRTDSGEKRPANLNALADEYLKIAYQGLRAKDKAFECNLVTHFDTGLGQVEVVPQEIGRVLLNLYNNAFYAVRERQQQADSSYQPTITITTTKIKEGVQIRVSDNGTGMPDSVKAKIFQPFFTTKPTGEGTGLGLSLSYDIITKGHSGQLSVTSQPGQGTEFVVSLSA